MPRNFELPGKLNLKDPRIIMRGILGLLLLANLVALVMLLKPFGGSAEDLRLQQIALTKQLDQAKIRLANTKKLADKVQSARRDGDEFLSKYFMDEPTT